MTALTQGLGSGGPDAAHAQAGWLVAESGQGWWTEDAVTETLRAEGENRPSRPSDIVSVTGEVAHTLTGEGFDASEDGTGRGNPIVPVSEGDLEERAVWQGQGSNVGPLGTLRAGNGNAAGGVPFVAETFVPDVAATLTSGSHSDGVNPPGRRAEDDVNLVAYERDAGDGRSVPDDAAGPRAIGFANQHRVEPREELAETVTGSNGQPGCVAVRAPTSSAVAVRRLTPTECERLQGFPDGWTDVDGAADSPRYKQLGNAVATVCSGWIGWRIDAYMRGWRPA